MYSIDIVSLKSGAVANDGGIGTVLTSPGDIVDKTVKFNPADPAKSVHYAVGKGHPVLIALRNGEWTLNFDIMTADVEVIQDWCGGTLVGATPNKMWGPALGNPPIIEKSVEVLDGSGFTWQFVRLQVSAKLVGEYSPENPNVIRVMATIMQPTKAATPAIGFGVKETP